MTATTNEPTDEPTNDQMMQFFSGIPHRVANAGLSSEQVGEVADIFETLSDQVRRSGAERVVEEGPSPDSFPPDSDRIAAAAKDIDGRLHDIHPDAWDTAVDDSTIGERCRQVMMKLVDDYGFAGVEADD